MEFLGPLALILGVAFVIVLTQIPRLIFNCGPNEVLVFSGPGEQGKHYRIVKGGFAIRKPIIEKIDRVDLTNMNIEVEVKNAFAKGGIPLHVSGVANVKVAGQSPGLDNALERLLGKPRPVLVRIAKETLEGYLRGVLASLTPEQVNESTRDFEKELRRQAGEGLDRLGLTLDNLKIQSISDEVGYLTAVGRIASANLTRDNRIAVANRDAEARIKQAEARRQGELAKIQADLEIARAESARRVTNAETAKQAFVAEQQGEVAALLTQAKAELALQDARIEQARHQLQAEVVTPAKADMEARIAQARGSAAPILEQGRAQAEALSALAKQWHEAGDAARDVFVLQKLETILPTFLESIGRVRVDNVTMLQGGNGKSGNFSHQAVSTVKALEAGGLDVSGLLSALTGAEPKAQNRNRPSGRLAIPQGALDPSPPIQAQAPARAPKARIVSEQRRGTSRM